MNLYQIIIRRYESKRKSIDISYDVYANNEEEARQYIKNLIELEWNKDNAYNPKYGFVGGIDLVVEGIKPGKILALHQSNYTLSSDLDSGFNDNHVETSRHYLAYTDPIEFYNLEGK